MTLVDVAAQNASLDNDYGATKGPNAPASHEVALFHGDPAAGGTELTAGGYARVVIANNGTTWAAAAGGVKSANNPVELAFTGAPSDTATHFLLLDHTDGTTRWDSAPLDSEVVVGPAGGTASISISIFYGGSS